MLLVVRGDFLQLGPSDLWRPVPTVSTMIWSRLRDGRCIDRQTGRQTNGSFHKTSGLLPSTLSVLREGVEGHVDISELTWEQREQVLRLLFSKMNASHPLVRPHTSLPQLPAPRKEEGGDDKQHQQRHR